MAAPDFIPAGGLAPDDQKKTSSASPDFIPAPAAVAAKAEKPPESHVYTGVGDTLIREAKAAGQMLNPVAVGKSLYHAATDEPTADEKAQFGDKAYQHAGPAGRLIGRTVVAPVMTAGKYYADVARGKMGDASAVESQMLDVAPEAIGQAGGTVIGGKLIEAAGKVGRAAMREKGVPLPPGSEGPSVPSAADVAKEQFGPKTVDIAKATPGAIIRGTGRAMQNPFVSRIAGPAALTAGGAALGVPVGTAAEIAGGAGLLGDATGVPKLIQRTGQRLAEVGLPEDVKLQNRTTRIVSDLQKKADTVLNRMDRIASSGGEIPDSMQRRYDALRRSIADESKSFPQYRNDLQNVDIQKLISGPRNAAKASFTPGGEMNPTRVGPAEEKLIKMQTEPVVKPGVKIGEQNKPAVGPENAPAPEPSDIPEGHTPTTSSALKSYKYDSGASEFHAQYNKATNHIHVFGDVTPEEAAAFEKNPSKGTALSEIRKSHPQVAKIIDGKRINMKGEKE